MTATEAAEARALTAQWLAARSRSSSSTNNDDSGTAKSAPQALPKLTPYCRTVMNLWLSKCVFGDGSGPMPDALNITPECRRIYNTNAKDCMTGGVMTPDQEAAAPAK